MELADNMFQGGNDEQAHSPTGPPASYAPHTLRSDLNQQGRLPVEECIRVSIQLASALAHLHQHGLVHRDIKPSNIIFVKGQPKLADIGFVAETEDAFSFVGTTGYISPEGPGTPQADLFSLGKLIYVTITGLSHQEFPRFPQDFRKLPEYPRLIELNQVILKACETNPKRRYRSAMDMQTDLQRLQEGKSVKQIHTLKRFFSFAWPAAAVLSVVALLLAGLWHFHWKTVEEAMLETAKVTGIRPDQVDSLTADMKQTIESQDHLEFVDTFEIPLDRAWNIFPFPLCQSNAFTQTIGEEGTYTIQHHPHPSCNVFQIGFSPLEPSASFTDVQASVDIVDWSTNMVFGFAFRADMVSRSHGYLAGLGFWETEVVKRTALFINETANSLRTVVIPHIDPAKDYRLMLVAVDERILIRLFELGSSSHPVGVAMVTNSVVTEGGAGLYLQGRPHGSIALDNLNFTATPSSVNQP
jgi:hypothetical protein